MGIDRKYDPTNRSSMRPKKQLSIRRFEEIRDGQLIKGAKKMNVEIFDACNRMITLNMEVTAEEKEQAWQKIQTRIQQERKAEKRRPVLWYIIAAILCLALIGTIGFANGWFRIWWDNEQLWFERSQLSLIDNYSEIEKVEYDSVLGIEFIEALKEMDMHIQLPSYIPDGYKLKTVNMNSDGWQQVIASYRKGSSRLTIIVEKFSENIGITTGLEKDAKELQHYTVDGMEYVIYNNLTRLSACWQRDSYLVTISGEIIKDELIQMINSIGG